MNENQLQEVCRRFVDTNVHACVTGMVCELLDHDPDLVWSADAHVYNLECAQCGEHQSPVNLGMGCFSGDNVYCPMCKDYTEHDDAPKEVYEWWIVDPWFGQQLAAHGELVIDDCFGSIVWGRCTTGQAILLDAVVRDIVRELEIE